MTRLKKWSFAAGVLLTAVALLVSAALSFAVTPGDAGKLRDFDVAVARWQHNPDFRAVTREYVSLGVRAMQTRFCGVASKTVIMKFRSLPGLPATLAVNPTSASHYEDFSRGELSAYLHLCGEQDVEDGVPMIERLLALPNGPVKDEQIVALLSSFHMPVPIATDAGAIASVRALLREVAVAAPAPTFPIRTRITSPLAQPVARLAGELGVPSAPSDMTAVQQAKVFAALDDFLRRDEPQLWRTKQVSDLLAGIWAQGYGQIYQQGIRWLFRIERIARGVATILLLAVVFATRHVLQRRQASAQNEATAGIRS